jgi:hypothetical protein
MTDTLKDEILKVFRESTSMSKEMTAKLADSLKHSAEFAAEVEAIRQQTLTNWRNHQSEIKSIAKSFVEEFSKALMRVTNLASEGGSAVSEALSNLSKDVQGNHHP